MTVSQSLAVPSDRTVRSSQYARLCQAAHLLSRTINHFRDNETDGALNYTEALQLRKTTSCLSDAILYEINNITDEERVASIGHLQPHDRPMLLSALAITYSALFCLYDKYCCPEAGVISDIGTPEQQDLQDVAITGLEETCARIVELAEWLKEGIAIDEAVPISPLVMNCLYQAGAAMTWSHQETGEEYYETKLRVITSLFEKLEGRWAAASKYLSTDSYSEGGLVF